MEAKLKNFLDAKKVDTRLLGDIERHLMKAPPSDRSSLVLHPSEIIKPDFCHKYSQYLLEGGTKKPDNPGLRMQNIFDEGHYIHEKWQNRLYSMGTLYGDFQCLACRTVMSGLSPLKCTWCSSVAPLRYQEVKLFDKGLRIAGHTDGWVKDDQPDVLIEVKSVGEGTLRFEAPELLRDAGGDAAKAWKNVRRPFLGHLRQGQMYLELAKREYGEAAPRKIVFIYEFKANQDYKEFTVKADFDVVERYFFTAEKIVTAVKRNNQLECNIGGDAGCKMCNLITA